MASNTELWWTAHLGFNFVDHFISKHEIDHSVHICVVAKILVVVAGEGVVDPMMLIQH